MGTLDGATIEMAEEAGEENLFLADHFMHLADLTSYVEAQDRLGDLYAKRNESERKPILNIPRSGKFSSDRTIHEYASEIWKAEPCPVL